MDLPTYYRILFALVQHHKYSLRDVYDMYPFERDIFLVLLEQHIKEQEEKQKQNDYN